MRTIGSGYSPRVQASLLIVRPSSSISAPAKITSERQQCSRQSTTAPLGNSRRDLRPAADRARARWRVVCPEHRLPDAEEASERAEPLIARRRAKIANLGKDKPESCRLMEVMPSVEPSPAQRTQ